MDGDFLSLTGDHNIHVMGQAIIAMGALGSASSALVDASKSLWSNGISKTGFKYIRRELERYGTSLTKSLGDDWATVLLGQWINGRDLAEQKSAATSAVMLGLDATTATELAKHLAIEETALSAAAAALAAGAGEMNPAHAQVLSRARSSLVMRIDGAYERADQAYRNNAKTAAMVLAIFLAVCVQYASKGGSLSDFANSRSFLEALLIGFLAVPVAPVAKDLASALSTAAKALKLGRP